MKHVFLLVLGLVTGQSVFGQGTVFFYNHVPQVGLDAPVFDVDGFGVAGSQFRAQLYGGPVGSSLAPIGPSVTFGPAPGYWGGFESSLVRIIPNVTPGSTAELQVKVWSVVRAPTYDQVAALNGKHGVSELFTVITGGDTKGGADPPGFPAYLTGLRSFNLTGVEPKLIPEPSTIAFIVIGAGVVLFCGKRHSYGRRTTR